MTEWNEWVKKFWEKHEYEYSEAVRVDKHVHTVQTSHIVRSNLASFSKKKIQGKTSVLLKTRDDTALSLRL